MRGVLLLGLLVGLSLVAGCATMTQSPGEVAANYNRVLDIELRQMADDTNSVFMLDTAPRLTRWHMR